MKTSKKMLSLLLIAAMLVSVLCMGVSATEDYDPHRLWQRFRRQPRSCRCSGF